MGYYPLTADAHPEAPVAQAPSNILYSLLAFLLPIAVMAIVYQPSLPYLQNYVPESGFNSGHVWVFDHIKQMLTGSRPLTQYTPQLGYPTGALLQPIAWVPAIAAIPFNALLGPVAAYNIILFTTPGVSALTAFFLFRRLTNAHPAVACAAALPFALSPFMLGSLISGQIAKTQGWILCLPLLGLSLALAEGPRKRLLGLALLGLSGLGAAFTSPSLYMQLPFALVLTGAALLLARLFKDKAKAKAKAKALGMGLLGALIMAAAAYPAYHYYEGATQASRRDPGRFNQSDKDVIPDGFFPANRPSSADQAADAVTQIDRIIIPRYYTQLGGGTTAHVTFLPLPLLLGALFLAWGRSRGRALGAAIFLTGATLALGEYAFFDEQLLRINGSLIKLPARWLYEAGYPLGASGAYYRLMALASLGLSLLFCAGAARLRPKWGIPLSWAIALLSLAATLQGTRILWPVSPALTLPPDIAAIMASDPRPGAVLDLPLDLPQRAPERILKDAALHGRPVWALPRPINLREFPPLQALARDTNLALEADSPHQALADLGFAYVVLWPRQGHPPQPNAGTIPERLGPASYAGNAFQIWALPPKSP